jgi:hypothetical protein
MDSLHRSKHLWCLKRYKEASIDRSKTEDEIENVDKIEAKPKVR